MNQQQPIFSEEEIYNTILKYKNAVKIIPAESLHLMNMHYQVFAYRTGKHTCPDCIRSMMKNLFNWLDGYEKRIEQDKINQSERQAEIEQANKEIEDRVRKKEERKKEKEEYIANKVACGMSAEDALQHYIFEKCSEQNKKKDHLNKYLKPE